MWLVLRVLVCLGILMLSVMSQAQPMAASPEEAHWQQLTAQAQELYHQGRYAEALPVAQEALALAEATFGPAHLHAAASRHTLARLAHAAAGTSSIRDEFKFQQYFRDVHTITQHAFVSASRYESAGALMLGEESDWGFFAF